MLKLIIFRVSVVLRVHWGPEGIMSGDRSADQTGNIKFIFQVLLDGNVVVSSNIFTINLIKAWGGGVN